MKAKKVKGAECPDDVSVILKKDVVWRDFFQCGECDEVYDTKEDARSCCTEE